MIVYKAARHRCNRRLGWCLVLAAWMDLASLLSPTARQGYETQQVSSDGGSFKNLSTNI